MSMLGLDPTAVRALANQMANAASEIQQLASQLTNMLANTQWVGPDHDRFAGDWNGTHVHQLQLVANALSDASSVANQNVAQQEQASNS